MRAARAVETTRSSGRWNLLGAPSAELEVGDGIASLALHPFEIVSLRLGAASG